MPFTPLPEPGITPPNWGQMLNDAIESRYEDSLAALTAEPHQQPQTVALLGDSITWWNGINQGIYDTQVTAMHNHAQGYWSWANASLGGRLQVLRVAGVPGDTTAGVLARITDITSLPVMPGYCVVQVGTNDVLNDLTSEQITPNLDAIYAALRAEGITVVAVTIPPFFTTVSAEWEAQSEVNQWIRERAQQPGFILADVGGRWADPSVGGARSGLTTDGFHPTTVGAGALGKVIADAMRPYIGGSISLMHQNTDTTNALLNGMMLGTSGTITGGTGTGQLATSWLFNRTAGSGTITHAKVARTDLIAGEWQEWTVAGGGGTFIMWQNATIAGIAAGHKYQTEMEFDSANWTGITKFTLVGTSITGTGNGTTMNQLAAAGMNMSTEVTSGVLRTPVYTMGGSPTGIQTQVNIEATAGSIRFSRIRTRRVA